MDWQSSRRRPDLDAISAIQVCIFSNSDGIPRIAPATSSTTSTSGVGDTARSADPNQE